MLISSAQAANMLFRFIFFTLIGADKGCCVCFSESVDERLKHISLQRIMVLTLLSCPFSPILCTHSLLFSHVVKSQGPGTTQSKGRSWLFHFFFYSTDITDRLINLSEPKLPHL